MKILITGSEGMLAADFISAFSQSLDEIVLSDIAESSKRDLPYLKANIVDKQSIENLFNQIRPDVVVNTAAYTAVDKAEEERWAAFSVNALGPANLASAVRTEVQNGRTCKLVHISSDYVFGSATGGIGKSPFSEEDTYNPCGIYGMSKCLGDQHIAEIIPNQHLILRTSWLHGKHGPNFLETMLKLGKDRDKLSIVSDQIGSPTWTSWLAEVGCQLIESDANGIFHCSSEGELSWYDFAEEIFSQANITIDLHKQTTQELGRPAERPHYSVMSKSKLSNTIGCPPINWKDCIKNHLASL